jgi:hypothetical protein
VITSSAGVRQQRLTTEIHCRDRGDPRMRLGEAAIVCPLVTPVAGRDLDRPAVRSLLDGFLARLA